MALTFLLKKSLQNYSYAANFESIQLLCIRHVQPSLNSRFYSSDAEFYSSDAEYEIPDEQTLNSLQSLFENYGFTKNNQFSSLIITQKPCFWTNYPKFLENLELCLGYFSSSGFSPVDLENYTLAEDDYDLSTIYSLQYMIFNHLYLKSVLHTDEDVIYSIRRCPWLLHEHGSRYELAPIFEVLRECEIPAIKISSLLNTQSRNISKRIGYPYRFTEIIKETKKMGFDPCRRNFMEAVRVLTSFKESTWERKKEIFRKWGWSDEEILAAFKKEPHIMGTSDKKIETAMDFLVNKMGRVSSEVAECPRIFGCSLENWIVPRFLVYQFLLSKGLIKEKRLWTLSQINKEKFFEKYVEPYTAEFPELLTIYEPKVVSLDVADKPIL